MTVRRHLIRFVALILMLCVAPVAAATPVIGQRVMTADHPPGRGAQLRRGASRASERSRVRMVSPWAMGGSSCHSPAPPTITSQRPLP